MSDILKYGNSFCVLPFIHKHIDLTNKRRVCCISSDEITEERLQGIRQDMLANLPVPECKVCANTELQKTVSSRQKVTAEWFRKRPDIDYDYPPEISYDLRYSNVCNLRCQMCGPVASSTWAKFLNKQDVYQTLEPDVFEVNPEAARIYLAGGEPVMVKSFSTLLDKIENQDCEIIINTNATILTEKMLSALERFTNVCFVLSIDGTGETIERIRTLCSWDIIQKNIDVLQSRLNPTLMVNTVLQRDNIDNIPELVNWIDSKGIAKWDAEILTYPDQYHYSNYTGTINWPNDLWSAQCVTKNLQANSALKQIYTNLSDQS